MCVHTTNTRSGTEADDDDDAPRQIDQSKFCILYSVKLLSQHYQKPQIFFYALHKIQKMILRFRVLIVVLLKNQDFLDVTMCQIITIYLSQQHNTISRLVLHKQHHYKALQFYTTQIHSHRVDTRYWTLTQSCGIKPFTNVSNNRKYDCYVSCWYASQVSFLHLTSHSYFQTSTVKYPMQDFRFSWW